MQFKIILIIVLFIGSVQLPKYWLAYSFLRHNKGGRKDETIIKDIRREELSLNTNKKTKNETVDLRSQSDHISKKQFLKFYQCITAIEMGQIQIIFRNL
jgi:hypothetical protein